MKTQAKVGEIEYLGYESSSLLLSSPSVLEFNSCLKQLGVFKLCSSADHITILFENGQIYNLGHITENFQSGLNLLSSLPDTIIDIAFGKDYFIALSSNGHLYAFGDNSLCQLGLSNHNNTSLPTLIHSLQNRQVLQTIKTKERIEKLRLWNKKLNIKMIVSCGIDHTLCLVNPQSSLDLYSWGNNIYGQLGHHPSISILPTPRFISLHSSYHIIQITCGDGFTLALSNQGLVYCWGQKYYFHQKKKNKDQSNNEIKESQTTPNHHPFLIKQLTDVIHIDSGYSHCVALTKTNLVYVWGYNHYGQLGLGHLNPSHLPSLLPFSSSLPISSITCGPYHTILLGSDHRYYFSGHNPQNVFNLSDEYIVSPIPLSFTSSSSSLQQIASCRQGIAFFIPCSIESITPSLISLQPTTLSIKVRGYHQQSLQNLIIPVLFTIIQQSQSPNSNSKPIEYYIDGHYDSSNQILTVNTPPLDDINHQSLSSFSIYVQLQVSPDKKSLTEWSPFISIYTPPSSPLSLSPLSGPLYGDTPLSITFQPNDINTQLVYPDLSIRFTESKSETSIVVPATLSTQHIACYTPSFEHLNLPSVSLSSPIQCSVSVSLNGVDFQPLHQKFSYIPLVFDDVSPKTLTLRGGKVVIHATGLYFQKNSDIVIRISSQDDFPLISSFPAEYLPDKDKNIEKKENLEIEEKKMEIQEAEKDKGSVEETVDPTQISESVDIKETKTPEDQIIEPQSKDIEVTPTVEIEFKSETVEPETIFESISTTTPSKEDGEKDNVDEGTGVIIFIAPSYIEHGPSACLVELSLDGGNKWIGIPQHISYIQPSLNIQRISGQCGHISGGTKISIAGEGFDERFITSLHLSPPSEAELLEKSLLKDIDPSIFPLILSPHSVCPENISFLSPSLPLSSLSQPSSLVCTLYCENINITTFPFTYYNNIEFDEVSPSTVPLTSPPIVLISGINFIISQEINIRLSIKSKKDEMIFNEILSAEYFQPLDNDGNPQVQYRKKKKKKEKEEKEILHFIRFQPPCLTSLSLISSSSTSRFSGSLEISFNGQEYLPLSISLNFSSQKSVAKSPAKKI